MFLSPPSLNSSAVTTRQQHGLPYNGSPSSWVNTRIAKGLSTREGNKQRARTNP